MHDADAAMGPVWSRPDQRRPPAAGVFRCLPMCSTPPFQSRRQHASPTFGRPATRWGFASSGPHGKQQTRRTSPPHRRGAHPCMSVVNLDQTPAPSPHIVPYRELGIRRQARTLPRKAEPHPRGPGAVPALVTSTYICPPLIDVIETRGLPSFRELLHLQGDNVVVFSNTSSSLLVSQGLGGIGPGRIGPGRIGLGTYPDSWYNNNSVSTPFSPPCPQDQTQFVPAMSPTAACHLAPLANNKVVEIHFGGPYRERPLQRRLRRLPSVTKSRDTRRTQPGIWQREGPTERNLDETCGHQVLVTSKPAMEHLAG